MHGKRHDAQLVRGEHHHRPVVLAGGMPLGQRGEELGVAGEREIGAAHDVLGDGVGDDGGGFPAHDGSRRRLDRVNDAGGVGGIRNRRRDGRTGSGLCNTGSAAPNSSGASPGALMTARGTASPSSRARSARTSLSAKTTNGIEALVAALEPRPQRDLQPDAGRIAHADGQRPPPARIRRPRPSAVLDMGVRTQILQVLLGNDLELFLA